MTAHEVVSTGELRAVCRCGEVFEAVSYERARIDHCRHALQHRGDVVQVEDEDVPF